VRITRTLGWKACAAYTRVAVPPVLLPDVKLSAAQLRYLTDVDHRIHEALIAIDPSADEGICVARFIRSTNCPTDAEAAVVVVDGWQRRGVGTALRAARRAKKASPRSRPHHPRWRLGCSWPGCQDVNSAASSRRRPHGGALGEAREAQRHE
jgi:hypothetical protein